MGPLLLLIYLILCLLNGTLGRGTRVGYWGTVFLSALITPFVAFIALLLFQRRLDAGGREQRPAA